MSRQGIKLRCDFSSKQLRAFAKGSRDANQVRRLLAIAAVLDGASRLHAAKIGGMDRQTLRDWVHRFNAEGPDGLIDRTSSGAPPKLNKAHKQALAAYVERGPIPSAHGVVRWRACDLVAFVWQEFRIAVSDDTIYRALHELGFAHVSARPQHHAQDEEALEAFKKTSPSGWRKSEPGCPKAHP